MDELISREALKQVLLSKGFNPAIVGRAIDAAPAVAAVPVVRCKECKFFEPSAVTIRFYCDWHRDTFETFPDDFCSYGERKDDEHIHT